ncbi:MAG TPA: lipoxygenase family protein, partial [Myxococcota bacterium]|nr:lipoxygenase family protein [Myxococcota bacterium]HND33802.1 lipoxygenase family protein [Myxococcota bacterium]
GSLFINNAAVTTLIKPGGVVDKILSPTIQASTALAVQSVTGYQFEKMWVPNELASRGVENPAKLPDYPYRDDAMLLWSVIHTWVEGYLGVYYNGDEAVQKDSELMEWANEIAASIPSFGPVTTFDYLVNAVTHFLFTGSAQHAAVNFQQSFLMSFAPSMPLAAYIPPNSGFDQQDYLKQLPPLQNAVLQQAVGLLLGGVYYTRLGDYDRYRGSSYFQDPRISGALGRFHAELRAAEKEIGRRNLDRIPYTLLLPSSIPQSINI